MTALSSDRPSSDPKDDLFGHSPFARSLAASISKYPSNDGLVLALYGPWGSGKSTVLSYVRYFLLKQEDFERPVIVDFNPWWFSGHDNLARAFLGQLQAVLPVKSYKFKKLGALLGDFAEGVGGLVDLTGMTGGWGSKIGQIVGLASKPKPKDVPALKSEVSKILLEAKQKVLIIIDDIDRLTPDETRQLFTVIKALADFPNVIYLLAFDREVAANAIHNQSGLPGERYLEKIIQVPFELPPVDREALRVAFFKRLDEVLIGTPNGLFDQSYWTNVFYSGIDSLIQVPRDVVRFTNTLSVTYPSVVGEVNPVDFIAIEALRVFLPSVYEVLRSHPENFAGHKNHGGAQDDKVQQEFHDVWLNELSEAQRANVWGLMQRIFPKLEKTVYGSDWVSKWRSKERACVPEIFPIYFRLSVPVGMVRRSEMQALIALASVPAELANALIHATQEIRPDGLSKVRALLGRLMDYVENEIPNKDVAVFINVLLDIGDKLVLESDAQGMFNFGNETRVGRIVYHLLKRIDAAQRLSQLREAILQGNSIGIQNYLLANLLDEIEKYKEGGPEPLIESAMGDELKIVWINRLKSQSDDSLLDNNQFARMVAAWYRWGDSREVRAWCEQVTASDEGLFSFLPRFCQHTTSQTIGDWAIRVKPRLNPTWLERFIDIEVCASRLNNLQKTGQIPQLAQEAVGQFLKEFEMLKSGKNPDGMSAFDDDD